MRNSQPSGQSAQLVSSERRYATPAESPAEPPVRIRPAAPRLVSRNLLLDLPIFWRLTLGFLLAALIAGVAAGFSGFQRAASLTRESGSYQSLLSANTSLTTADSFLQLMNTESHTLVTDAGVPTPSKDTLATDQSALQGLSDRYDALLGAYVRGGLLGQNGDQVALLDEAGHGQQVGQQKSLAASALRTWQVYRAAQAQVAQDVASGNLTEAEALLRAQLEPTNADAQSALRALIQFNSRIASSVQDAAVVEEHSQVISSGVAAAVAFLCILGVGWIISATLVTRLRQLRRVTQAVEEGELGQRVEVYGRDEVAGVSASVNGMLDTIVGLLDVTRRQRDALTNAAERLFADVRVAGAGDLRVNAAVSGDPIGMLGNAFNFTIGRFRRFVLRTHMASEQLDVVGRQQFDRAGAFLAAAQHYAKPGGSVPAGAFGEVTRPAGHTASAPDVAAQTERARDLLRRVAREGAGQHSRYVLDYAEQAYLSAGRLSQLAISARQALAQRNAAALDGLLGHQMDELRTLGGLLSQVGTSAEAIQRNATSGIADLDGALQRIAVASVSLAASPQGQTTPHTGSVPSLSGAQVSDLLRLSQAFAQDVAVLARQVLAVTQEIRAGAAPFRIGAQPDDSLLYAPGTGYDEPAGYSAFGGDESQPGYGLPARGASAPGRMAPFGGRSMPDR